VPRLSSTPTNFPVPTSLGSIVLHFWRLSRPVFLLGGLAFFAVGVGWARLQQQTVEASVYVLGQLFVSSLQLMTHYLNEYWDVEADRLNASRTWFSGGSGVLAAGLLRPRTALAAACGCLAVAATAAILLAAGGSLGLPAVLVMAGMFLGAFFYSSPPLALAGSGAGELAASVVVAGLVPLLGLLLAGGRPTWGFAWVAGPLALLHFAMMLAFEFPDEAGDRAAGKWTLLVRLGRRRTARLHHVCLASATALLLAGALAGGAAAGLLAVVVAPLALWEARQVARAAQGDEVDLGRMTLIAAAIVALASILAAAAIWTQPVGSRWP
jgi:1,4-dihydroxy-2-naphthoate octaprenyltransferase